MTTTTYLHNFEASSHEDHLQMLAVAMCEVATAVQGENPANVFVPVGYNKGSTTEEKQQNLHEERATLAKAVLQNPLGYATWYALSAAEQIDLYVAGNVLFHAGRDSAPVNADYSTAVSGLWSAWSVDGAAVS